MNPNKRRQRETKNENMTCSVCNKSGLIVHTRKGINFTKHRSYRCEDCKAWYTIDDSGGIDEFKREPEMAEPAKTPIEMDRELGVVPK